MTRKPADIATLERLRGLIRERLAALPAFDYRDDAAWRIRDAALEKIFADLEASEGAKTGKTCAGAVLNLGGIRSTSTGGINGALSNWAVAAEKRIDAGKAGA